MKRNVKKITAAFLTAAMLGATFGTTINAENAEENVLSGDINSDGKLTARDLADFQYYLLTGDDEDLSLENADLNTDGKVNILDLILLKRSFVGDDDQTISNDNQNEWKYNVSGLDISSNGKILYSEGGRIKAKSISGETENYSMTCTITESCTLAGRFTNNTINIEPQNDNEEIWINLYDVEFENSKIIINEENGRRVYFYLPQGDNFTTSEDDELKRKYLDCIETIDQYVSKNEKYSNSFQANNTMILTKKYYVCFGSSGTQTSSLLINMDLNDLYSDEEEAFYNMVPDVYLCTADNGSVSDGPSISFSNMCVFTGQILCPNSDFSFRNSAIKTGNKLKYGYHDLSDVENISIIGKVDVGNVIEINPEFCLIYVDHDNAEDNTCFRAKQYSGFGYPRVLGSCEINGDNILIIRNPSCIEGDSVINPTCFATTAYLKLDFNNSSLNKQIRFKNDAIFLNKLSIYNKCPMKSDDGEYDVPSIISEGKLVFCSPVAYYENNPINVFTDAFLTADQAMLNINGNIYCYDSDPDFEINKKIDELRSFEVPVYSSDEIDNGIKEYTGKAVSTFGNFANVSGKIAVKGSMIIKNNFKAEELRVDQLLYAEKLFDAGIGSIYAKGGICTDSLNNLTQSTKEIYTTRIVDTEGNTIAEYDGEEYSFEDNIHIISEDDPRFEWQEYNDMP